MKTNIFRTVTITLMVLITSLTYTQCETNLTADLSNEQSSLSKTEAESLIKLREEEMLAHDVYLAFSELYSVPVFRNISKSEMVHTEAVKTLIDRYELEDPALEHETGKFTDPHFQELYTELVERGSSALEEAILVGLLIEDLDIADLEIALETEIKSEDIKLVYENLLRGSQNHMKAFYAHASGRDLDYTPVYISSERFMEIIGAEIP
jgi:hypothetical protein